MQSSGLAGAIFATLRPARALQLEPWGLFSRFHPADLVPNHHGLPPPLALLTRSLLTPHEKTPEVKALKPPTSMAENRHSEGA